MDFLQRFWSHVAAQPDKIAVIVHGGDALTYGELSACASLLYNDRLKDLSPDDVVPVMMGQCLELAIAVVAIAMAGGAYCNVDSRWPPARQRAVFEQLQAKVVLSASAGRAPLVAHHLVDAKELRRRAVSMPTAAGLRQVDLRSLAYVVFTSGSTGVPKGVQIEHRSLAALIDAHEGEEVLVESDRRLMINSVAFDAHIMDLFGVLGIGATLVMPGDGRATDVAWLAGAVAEHEVTAVDAVCSLIEAWLSTTWAPAIFGRLRIVATGGERLTASVLERLEACGRPGLRVYNLYGPAECTVDCLYHRCPLGTSLANAPPPIGTSWPHVLTHVTDEGELCIGGIGVFRGYLGGGDDQTFTHPEHGRMYRTGDLVRCTPPVYEYVGRLVEGQVKVRGQRLELAEVEACLAPLAEQVVVVLAPRWGDLVAFFTSQADDVAAAMATHAKTMLPRHAVPTAYIRLASMPITPTFKLDRAALRTRADEHFDLGIGNEEGEDLQRAWSNGEEQVLAALQSLLPGTSGRLLSRTVPFSVLGIDSLRMVRLIHALDMRISGGRNRVTMTMARMHDTIASLAAAIDEIEKVAATEDGGEPQCWAWTGMECFGSIDPQVFAVRIAGFGLDLNRLERSLNAVVASQPALRMYWATSTSRLASIPRNPEVELVVKAERRIEILPAAIGWDESTEVFAARSQLLDSDVLSDFKLFQESDDSWVLLCNLSHLVCDAFSESLLVELLAKAYAASSSFRTASLPVWPRSPFDAPAIRTVPFAPVHPDDHYGWNSLADLVIPPAQSGSLAPRVKHVLSLPAEAPGDFGSVARIVLHTLMNLVPTVPEVGIFYPLQNRHPWNVEALGCQMIMAYARLERTRLQEDPLYLSSLFSRPTEEHEVFPLAERSLAHIKLMLNRFALFGPEIQATLPDEPVITMQHVDLGEPEAQEAYFGVEITIDLEHRTMTICFSSAHFSARNQDRILDRIRVELRDDVLA